MEKLSAIKNEWYLDWCLGWLWSMYPALLFPTTHPLQTWTVWTTANCLVVHLVVHHKLCLFNMRGLQVLQVSLQSSVATIINVTHFSYRSAVHTFHHYNPHIQLKLFGMVVGNDNGFWDIACCPWQDNSSVIVSRKWSIRRKSLQNTMVHNIKQNKCI